MLRLFLLWIDRRMDKQGDSCIFLARQTLFAGGITTHQPKQAEPSRYVDESVCSLHFNSLVLVTKHKFWYDNSHVCTPFFNYSWKQEELFEETMGSWELELGCPNGTKYPRGNQFLTARFYLTARVYRRTDRQTDGRTGWLQYTPPLTSLRGV